MPDTEILFDIGGMFFFLIVLTLLVKPLGTYMTNVYQGKRTFFSPFLVPLENLIYKAAGVKQDEEMDWIDYAKALLLFNGLGLIGISSGSCIQYSHKLCYKYQLAGI
jgi:K+-transporting ATPase ATPase A chain